MKKYILLRYICIYKKIQKCLISDRRPKHMFNVLDLVDNSDIEDFIVSDEERQADSNDDYNPVGTYGRSLLDGGPCYEH